MLFYTAKTRSTFPNILQIERKHGFTFHAEQNGERTEYSISVLFSAPFCGIEWVNGKLFLISEWDWEWWDVDAVKMYPVYMYLHKWGRCYWQTLYAFQNTGKWERHYDSILPHVHVYKSVLVWMIGWYFYCWYTPCTFSLCVYYSCLVHVWY